MAKLLIEIDTDNHSVTYNIDSKSIYAHLNKHLLKRQNCTDGDVEMILMSHALRAAMFVAMENTDDVETLRRYDRAYAHLQRCQQELWGFPQNDNFLRYWDVPKCNCPKMDNDDNYGTQYRITSGACKIHWNESEVGKDETE